MINLIRDLDILHLICFLYFRKHAPDLLTDQKEFLVFILEKAVCNFFAFYAEYLTLSYIDEWIAFYLNSGKQKNKV